MERNRQCERFIKQSLQRSPCRIEAFDGREFNKATVNASINNLLHDEVIHNVGIIYHLGPPPVAVRKRKITQPNFAKYIALWDKGQPKVSEHKMRVARFTGELTDKSSAERKAR